MAIDAYTRTADNLAAVAATLEAMRAIERHGGAQILERAAREIQQVGPVVRVHIGEDVHAFRFQTRDRVG